MTTAAEQLRELVEARALSRCEYCRRYQNLVGRMFFEMEHILARTRGGLTVPANLALACRRCNIYKSDILQAFDPRTQRLVPLFHPRRDQWHDHFYRSRDLFRIYGRTASGRATAQLLRFNEPSEQQTRQIQRDYLADVFPLD